MRVVGGSPACSWQPSPGPPQGMCGCLRGSGGRADGRGSAGSDPACGKCQERETGDTGYPFPSSFPAAGWEGQCWHPERQEPVLGATVGAPMPSSDVAIKVFPEPFPAPVCQPPFHRHCWSSFSVNAALVTASLAAAQEMKAINEQLRHTSSERKGQHFI